MYSFPPRNPKRKPAMRQKRYIRARTPVRRRGRFPMGIGGKR